MIADNTFEGRLYRALNPVWAAQPFSGEGARSHGGRFNPLGVPALYCSLSPVTAMREAMRRDGEAPTQQFARQLMDDGWNGLLVRSFARASDTEDLNLVLWRWGDVSPSRRVLIDDEGRLGASL